MFAVTFVVAGVGWLSQTRLQSQLSPVGPRLAFLNIISLMLVSPLPFPSCCPLPRRPGWQATRLGQRALIDLRVFALMTVLAFTARSLALFVPFALMLIHPLLSQVRARGW